MKVPRGAPPPGSPPCGPSSLLEVALGRGFHEVSHKRRRVLSATPLMNRKDHKIELARAKQLVKDARAIVKRQRTRIAKLQADGASTRLYERTLKAFENSLQTLEYHVRLLQSELGE
jgi:hypothetical protein